MHKKTLTYKKIVGYKKNLCHILSAEVFTSDIQIITNLIFYTYIFQFVNVLFKHYLYYGYLKIIHKIRSSQKYFAWINSSTFQHVKYNI